MSFAAEVKKELTGLIVGTDNAKSELAALLRMNGVTSLGMQQRLSVQTENAAIARRIYTLLKETYGVDVDVAVQDSARLNQKKTFSVRVNDNIDGILAELGVDAFGLHPAIPPYLLNQVDKRRSYLRGAFLAAGSVNSPEKSHYHLEIYTTHEEFAEELVQLMKEFDLPGKIADRKPGYIVYLKRSDKIAEFLSRIGATNTMLHFEDVRLMRDMRNSANRLVNAEVANMQKTAIAASQQVDMIHEIAEMIGGLQKLPLKLREFAEVRLAHPDESLGEIGELMPGKPISKSGVNHRLRKLKQLHAALQNGDEVDLTNL
jgi:DNA-binding protein WhiA